MPNAHLSASLLLATTALLAGCGSLDGHTDRPDVLTNIHGTLDTPSGPAPTGNVRIALVWMGLASDVNSSEDLPIQPIFPAQFTLALHHAPPADAMLRESSADGVAQADASVPYDFQIAYGSVVAYEDRNGNGALDLVRDDAGAFIDQVLAIDSSSAVVFLQGEVPQGVLKVTLTPGYSLLTTHAGCPSPPVYDGSVNCDWDRVLPIDTPLHLTVSNDPQLNEIMCSTYGHHAGSSGTALQWSVTEQGTPPGGYPASDAAGLACSPSGGSYRYQRCVLVGFCKGEEDCIDWSVTLFDAAPTAKPAGWPCP